MTRDFPTTIAPNQLWGAPVQGITRDAVVEFASPRCGHCQADTRRDFDCFIEKCPRDAVQGRG